jgi:acylglycerol kinase
MCVIFFLQTEYEGQAKRFMTVLDTTDAIVVCGGDGTLSEVSVSSATK